MHQNILSPDFRDVIYELSGLSRQHNIGCPRFLTLLSLVFRCHRRCRGEVSQEGPWEPPYPLSKQRVLINAPGRSNLTLKGSYSLSKAKLCCAEEKEEKLKRSVSIFYSESKRNATPLFSANHMRSTGPPSLCQGRF